MMFLAKHIFCQKRATNCFFWRPRAAAPANAKKSELIVNFGEAKNRRFRQFRIAKFVARLRTFDKPHSTLKK